MLSKRDKVIVNNFRILESTHVFTATDNKIVIQYWFFYLYNDHTFDHEGDWEMIQIILDEDENPLETGYSQHYDGQTRGWSNTPKENGHPKVYVAKGGHGSFYDENLIPGTPDQRGDFGETFTFRNQDEYTINILTSEGWLNFQGNWGEDGGSVPAAVFRHTKPDLGNAWLTPTSYMWIEPIYWQSVI